jgi:2-keto-4-pentenoate hydratase
MPLDNATITTIAVELRTAERSCIAGAPLIKRYPGIDAADAYAVQEAYARLRLAEGTTLVGRKIGATSRAIQQLFNIDTPDYGHLFQDMSVPDGGVIDTATLIAPMVEPEIAFRLGRTLTGPELVIEDVLAATISVAPALEVIDSRILDWEISFADTVADNGSSARFVLGREIAFTGHLDLATEQVVLRRDGEVLATADGTAVLGHPAASVAWLGNALAAFGRSLQAGDVVLSGSLTSADPARVRSRYVADFAHLGSVSCSFR